MIRRNLLITLVLLAAVGLVLHYRAHNFMIPDKLHPGAFLFSKTFFLASIFPFIDLVLVTALFMSRRTAVYGYLLNGLIAVYGTVFMGHYAIASFYASNLPPMDWIFKSMLLDIGLVWVDFLTGKTLYDFYMGRIGI